MKHKKGMFRVLAQKGKREFFDYVQRSRLAHLIKTGYVVGAPNLPLEEVKRLSSSEGITVIFDGDKKMARFQVE